MTPVTVDVPGGPILAEIVEIVEPVAGDDATLRVRFGDALVLVLPAELAEELADAVIEASAARYAVVTPARRG
jgi:hypothetical protein